MPSSETGILIPYNPAALPCGWDRADGLGGRMGDAASDRVKATWPGATDPAKNTAANMPLQEEADSPVIENAEQQTITHRFHGGRNTAFTLLNGLHRGIIRQDSNGNIVKLLSATGQSQGADHATLHTVDEVMSGDTPPDRFEVVPVEMGLNIIKHPRYFYSFFGNSYGSATESENQMVIRLLQDYFDNTSYQFRDGLIRLLVQSLGHTGTNPQPPRGALDSATNAWKWDSPVGGGTAYIKGTNMAKAAAIEIISKYWRGEETPSMVAVQLSWTEFYWTPQFLNPGGYIEDPITGGGLPDFLWSTHFPADPNDLYTIFWGMAQINPQNYSDIGNRAGSTRISWRREADREVRERTFFGIEHRWTGSPFGHWDEQLYSQTSRPTRYENYLPVYKEDGTTLSWNYIPTTY